MIEPPPPRQADEEHWTPLIVLEADHEAAEHARDLKEAWRKPRYEWVAEEIKSSALATLAKLPLTLTLALALGMSGWRGRSWRSTRATHQHSRCATPSRIQ